MPGASDSGLALETAGPMGGDAGASLQGESGGECGNLARGIR